MDLNAIIFPKPDVAWNYRKYLGHLVWVPAKKREVGAEVFLENLELLIAHVRLRSPGPLRRRESERPRS